jgi:ribose 5-phosphate isomerase A
LFIDICDVVVIGHGDGRVETRDINSGETTEDTVRFADSENIFADMD